MNESYQRLCAGLSELRLGAMRDGLDAAIDRAVSGEGFVDVLSELVQNQVRAKRETKTRNLINDAHFPSVKTFDGFDFGFQPGLNRAEVLDLANLRFMQDGSNVVFLGMPGVGKTHLAIATGVEAAKTGKSVYFITCEELLAMLRKARGEGMLEQKMRRFATYSLLIVDEVGYLPVDHDSADLMFELVARRYERRSTIVTTNQPFSKWGELFGDTMLANAMLDRLLHHSKVFRINGKSFRTKDCDLRPAQATVPSAEGTVR